MQTRNSLILRIWLVRCTTNKLYINAKVSGLLPITIQPFDHIRWLQENFFNNLEQDWNKLASFRSIKTFTLETTLLKMKNFGLQKWWIWCGAYYCPLRHTACTYELLFERSPRDLSFNKKSDGPNYQKRMRGNNKLLLVDNCCTKLRHIFVTP